MVKTNLISGAFLFLSTTSPAMAFSCGPGGPGGSLCDFAEGYFTFTDFAVYRLYETSDRTITDFHIDFSDGTSFNTDIPTFTGPGLVAAELVLNKHESILTPTNAYFTPVLPVPEPQTWVSMLIGFTVIGAATRVWARRPRRVGSEQPSYTLT